MSDQADSYAAMLGAVGRGVQPDPVLWVDEWAEEHMRLPRKNAAEHGKYRLSRTPFAREPMRCLSPGHPCKRVVVKAASQLLKTQVGLNWLSASIHLAPANMLVLLPTLSLAKRVSTRIAETLGAIDVLEGSVAAPRSRDSRNTIDTKEFDGGTLYITTAGAASNLAEIPARYIYGDEIDRWDVDVDGEGDPIKLAEARLSTFSSSAKAYYTSSPTVDGVSRIQTLYDQGTQNVLLVPCPHCEERHVLEWENVHWNDQVTEVWMSCPHCAAPIKESDKAWMLPRYRWDPQSAGDGETESFEVSALYAPLGWVSWLQLAREFVAAKKAEDAGDPEAMQVFVNTRLARVWSAGKVAGTVQALLDRAEDYPEFTIPAGGLVLTSGVDVQHDRLAVEIWAWGRGEEGWLVYWGELHGETRFPRHGAWLVLEQMLTRTYRHACGAELEIRRMTVDTGDGVTQDGSYDFCRRFASRGVLAGKGDSERSVMRREIFTPPKPAVDTDRKNKAWRYGLKPYLIGTHAAKDRLIEARLPMADSGPGRLHWYKDVRSDFYDQLLAEVKVASRRHRGRKVWEKKVGARNEALDCLVMAYHAALALKINLWRESVWIALEQRLRQPTLLAAEQPNEDAPATGDGEIPTEPGADGEESDAHPSVAPETPPPAPVASRPRPVRPSRPRSGFSVTRF